MTIARGFGLGETHLMPDAIVAFVDNELSATAAHRACAHLSRCATCAAEAASQRQARNEVRALDAPGMSARLLAALQDIPNDTDVPAVPDGLAMTSDGQLVAVQRPDRAAALLGDGATLGGTGMLGESRMLGDGAPLGDRPLGDRPLGDAAPLGDRPLGAGRPFGGGRPFGRRAAQGAGALVSGLMLGALTLAAPPHLVAQAPASPPAKTPPSQRTAAPAARTQQGAPAAAQARRGGGRDNGPLTGTVPAGR